MLPFAKRFTILIGNYGSGKTELSLAIARYMRKQKPGKIALVDLDIVNPYFRGAEHRSLLESENIEVFMPSFAMSTVDVPALPAQIQAVFDQAFAHVVIDVGGDDTGAAALGRYAPFLAARREEISALYVVNPFRPLSSTPESIVELFSLIEQKARLHPDYLVNNGNLQEQTTVAELLEAQATLEAASALLHVPIGMVTGMERLRHELPSHLQSIYFSFEPLMKPDWLTESL